MFIAPSGFPSPSKSHILHSTICLCCPLASPLSFSPHSLGPLCCSLKGSCSSHSSLCAFLNILLRVFALTVPSARKALSSFSRLPPLPLESSVTCCLFNEDYPDLLIEFAALSTRVLSVSFSHGVYALYSDMSVIYCLCSVDWDGSLWSSAFLTDTR